MLSDVHKFSSQDRIAQRTVEQMFDASVVEVVPQQRIWERCAVPLFAEPKFSSRDHTWNRTVEQFSICVSQAVVYDVKCARFHADVVREIASQNRKTGFAGSKFCCRTEMLQRSVEQIQHVSQVLSNTF